ncbi:ubiquitin carboxyl-terminal hydrolase calypso-like [Sitophilus oryzae]|uniref:ubiquitinyl hydrolase 1 n=1 Tax=Sitophilus oryzae TaxID=7048 RepID=A0A6J2XH46_SITOR|nr:ubiquitin carboxyl-terminal hydrolase calypso-like [Sitophilus oryzae]
MIVYKKVISEAFQFVSFVPIGSRLYELDGLKPFPIDHGPCSDQDWTDKFRNVIQDRLGITDDEYNEIRFNLMAVVSDRRLAIQHKLKMLRTNKQRVVDALQQIVKVKDKGGGKIENVPENLSSRIVKNEVAGKTEEDTKITG